MCLGLVRRVGGAWGFGCVACHAACCLEEARQASSCLQACFEKGLTTGLWPGHCTLASHCDEDDSKLMIIMIVIDCHDSHFCYLDL